MNTNETMHSSTARLTGAALLLLIGFFSLTTISWAWSGLFVGGILAWLLAFGKSSKQAFKMPHRLWLIPVGVISYFIIGLLVGLLAQAIGFNWAASPESGKLGSIIFMIPFMLMGEELLGIGVLEGSLSSGLSLRSSTLLSALIFGLLHIPSYWDGSLFSTVMHVLLLQSVARLILNLIYLKAGKSIWASWITHLLIDLIALSIG
ncbi:CPBP family intramembrane metalloprotease [Enterococcus sp. DIV0242_7C1]|uniref:CAAX prenyl protease 2/Lysostaphin resistance protein A-like domain-containing protein n=1 Tax=Candidatus Enterococcus dunnyi TaxID=1834192 RepID=A0A200IU28_9ENTE|nr:MULTISPECIES: CPBP family glutamic-type intramembrane protease [unclassified Enterococcus]MBO0471180.1 CPBP family intramembrane metalloprotease [Enterococcus sp. DIV0242_7C1]OUZ28428.1 hypothetical protein A5889_003183 [Enterococcus sp. 9D6_DIV0238]